jgi:hypothetical protein
MKHLLAITVILAALLYPSAVTGAQTQLPFSVGIVEASGNVVPVAAFDGETWSNSWPADLAVEDAPELPPDLVEWTLWYQNPGKIAEDSRLSYDWTDRLQPACRRIRATGLIESVTNCSRNLALDTDAGGQPDLIGCLYCCALPNMGIATTAEVPPSEIERLDPQSDDSERILALLLPTFDVLETDVVERGTEHGVIDGLLRFSGQPLDPVRRRSVPLRLNKAFRISQDDDAAMYYVEIVRYYGTMATPAVPCPGYSYLRGWVRTGTARDMDIVDQDFGLWDCDLKSAVFDTPLVYWPHAAGIDLLVRRHIWESEEYLVLTLEDDMVLTRTDMRFRR